MKNKERIYSKNQRNWFVIKKDESVECIYFVPYKKVEGVGYCLSITIVRDDSMNPFKDVELREYSDMHEERKLLENMAQKFPHIQLLAQNMSWFQKN